jgi:predicted acyl esterase
MYITLAQRGYAVISQDCRGTGDSEPDTWDYYIYEPEDSVDFVEWVTKQAWFDGFLAGCGASYVAATQWCMAAHPGMSTIVPEVAGLGIAFNSARYYMFLNAYARSVGKGEGKVPVHYSDMERQMLEETLAGGYFNDPLERPFSAAPLERYPRLRTLSTLEGKRLVWKECIALPPAQRAELIKQALEVDLFTFVEMESLYTSFGHQVVYGAHTLPCTRPSDACGLLHAPALMITGWYDWGLNDMLESWDALMRDSREFVRSRSRLLITPSAHNMPGYHEGSSAHPELRRTYRTPTIIDLLLRWFDTVRADDLDSWPTVVYYMMGANAWYAASEWPPQGTQSVALYLGARGTLTLQSPQGDAHADSYTYRPEDPPPTVGGNILSYVYTPGSVDVSQVQQRADVLTYTTSPLDEPLDVVGPLRLILYASSTALDTDFSARLSDVFPDGRAIQLQSSVLRTRYRNSHGEPELLQPGRIYRFEIDLWATANRFNTGHRLRLDICSADFPRFDRNTNRGGEPGAPIAAEQTIYRDAEHPSHLILSVMRAS